MKKTILIITAILLVTNLILGYLISAYKPFNLGFTSIVILITGCLVFLLQSIKMKDGFIISLSFIFAILGIVEFILALLAPAHIQNNGYVIATIVLLVIQFILLLICNFTSKHV